MKIHVLASAIGLAAMATSCASILRGTSQNFTVESTPPGAQARLSTGETCAATPCTFRRARKEAFTVEVSKEGYETSVHQIRNPWSAAGTTTGIVGNAIIGGAIGIGVDAATGANRDLTPNPLQVTLVPVAPAIAEAPATAMPAPTLTPPTTTP